MVALESLRQAVGPLVKTLVIGSLLLVGNSAEAAIMTYIGVDVNSSPNPKATALTTLPNSNLAAAATFLSQLSAHGTETFESFANPTFTNFGLTFGSYGTGTLSSTTPNYSGRVREQTSGTSNGQGRYTIAGNHYFETDPGAINIPVPGAHGNTGDFTIDFTNPVSAFGFFAIDIGDFNGVLEVTYNLLGGGTHLETIGNPGTTSGVIFLGVTTNDALNPFTSVTFHDTHPAEDFVGYDNFIAGTLGESPEPGTLSETPEPGMLAIWGLGALAVGMIASRRKASA